MIAYHGTDFDFDEFENKHMLLETNGCCLNNGFYFHKDRSYAEGYGKHLLVCEIPDSEELICKWDDEKLEHSAFIEWMIRRSPNMKDSIEDQYEIAFWGLDTCIEKIVKTYNDLRYFQVFSYLSNDFFKEEEVEMNRLIKEYTGFKGVSEVDEYCVFLSEDIKILERQ